MTRRGSILVGTSDSHRVTKQEGIFESPSDAMQKGVSESAVSGVRLLEWDEVLLRGSEFSEAEFHKRRDAVSVW